MGRRQHYLIGKQLRKKYISDSPGFLSDKYNPNEVYVRATDINRTIESAQSQLLGLYPPGDEQLNLMNNQTQIAVPLFQVSSDIENDVTKNLGQNSIPFNQRFVPVHVYEMPLDKFQPSDYCQYINQEKSRRETSKELQDLLQRDHADLIQELAPKLGITDLQSFTSLNAVDSVDSIYARYFNQTPITGFEEQAFMDQMMDLLDQQFSYILTGNETALKLFVTGVLSEVVGQFRKQIQIDQDPSLKNKERLKLFFYSDHDDSIAALVKTFQYSLGKYPSYASQILFELRKQAQSQDYFVNLIINDVKVKIPNNCESKDSCNFDKFVEYIKSVSYYTKYQEYFQLCGIQVQIKMNEKLNIKPHSLHSFSSRYIQLNEFDFKQVELAMKVVASYIAILAASLIVWALINRKKSQKQAIQYNIQNDIVESDTPHSKNSIDIQIS
ncbi:histidine acid phosphatase family protein [Stylonychia lemnae]|uniref:Histidine acid phosphatase family protein n=1 Tax=Stylonychia lemnae TaxID=5949 RepID=A0A078AM07_STYLE|nr:histidine acid phosphatase family protein [Stylonychia lemnae]|eukprot:CDW82447.1 histidine acid phosphatase family protein [Stylonychia lemnae]